MASRKIQLPAIGGIRKVIQPGDTSFTPGTTIKEYGSGTVTLAQLKAALGVSSGGASTGGGSGASATLVPGQDLYGGGPLVGTVNLYSVPRSVRRPSVSTRRKFYLLQTVSSGGAGSLIVSDGTTTVNPTSEILFSGATVTDLGGGTASVAISGGGGGGTVYNTYVTKRRVTQRGRWLQPSLPPTGVVPGSYTSANITVGADGRISSASNGSGGGGTTVTNNIIVLRRKGIQRRPFSYSNPSVAASSGSNNPFNITVDTHGSGVPAFLEDDEFEGLALDTSGTRFAGAVPWTWQNQHSATSSLANGANTLATPGVGGSFEVSAIMQPIGSPSSTWKYRTKMLSISQGSGGNYVYSGMVMHDSVSGKIWTFHWINAGNQIEANIWASFTGTFVSTFGNTPLSTGWATVAYGQLTMYLELEYNGTNIIGRASTSGYDGSFIQVISGAGNTMGNLPDTIGLFCAANNSGNLNSTPFDWWRRVA